MAEAEKKQKKEKKKLTKFEKWFRTMHRLHRFVLRFVFPYKKYGHTEPYNDRAYLIVGNHKSVMDVIPAALATDRAVHFMAKKELFQKGIAKWFTKKCECIRVSRDGSDVRALMLAMKYLKNGENVSLFPEGARNKTDEIFLPFRSGATALSIKTKTPIVLIMQSKKMRVFRRQNYYYSEPFEFTEYYDKKLTDKDIEACDELLRQKMLEGYYAVKEITDNQKKKKKKRGEQAE